MSRKKQRNRTAKRRSATVVQVQSAEDASRLERMLDFGDDQPNPNLALEMYQGVVDRCQHAAALLVFDGSDVQLWDIPLGRCYLRSVFGVGASLWRLNRTQEAAGHFETVLQADPADHLFARYWLVASLLDAGRFEELKPLLNRYDEATAFWRYAQALWAFATDGDDELPCRRLTQAHHLDARFLDYLLGDELVWADRPIGFERGCDIAHSTARLLLPAWRSVPGAATWVRRVLRVPLGQSDPDLPFPRSQLLDLPRRDSTWQVAVRKLEAEHHGGGPCWVLGVADVEHKQMRCLTVIEGDPTADAVWRAMLPAFLHPFESDPQRPQRLVVSRSEFRRAWRAMLSELQIQCRLTYKPEPITQLLEGMASLMAAQELPTLNDDFNARDLPPGDATWQVDFFHQPVMISNEDVGVERPWSVLVIDKATGRLLCNEMIPGEPVAERLWEYAALAMRQVALRPQRIEVADSDGYDFLKPMLAAADVECVLLDELPELHSLCRQMASSIGGPEKCALADGQGVGRDGMESFYYAAARYFQQKPWKHVRGEIPIEINVAGFDTRYAVVLGRTGVTLGLVVHESWQDAADLIGGRVGSDQLTGLAVVFDEEAILAPADLYLVERYGWPIASPEAYPAVMSFRTRSQPVSPTADDLEFLTACLHCLPEFVKGHVERQMYQTSDDKPGRETRLGWMSRPPSRPPRPSFFRRLAAGLGETFRRDREPPARSAADAVAVQHTNRNGETYYLHQGRSKTGKPRYFFSKKPQGVICEQLPDGFEIYENSRGQVYCRRI